MLIFSAFVHQHCLRIFCQCVCCRWPTKYIFFCCRWPTIYMFFCCRSPTTVKLHLYYFHSSVQIMELAFIVFLFMPVIYRYIFLNFSLYLLFSFLILLSFPYIEFVICTILYILPTACLSDISGTVLHTDSYCLTLSALSS